MANDFIDRLRTIGGTKCLSFDDPEGSEKTGGIFYKVGKYDNHVDINRGLVDASMVKLIGGPDLAIDLPTEGSILAIVNYKHQYVVDVNDYLLGSAGTPDDPSEGSVLASINTKHTDIGGWYGNLWPHIDAIDTVSADLNLDSSNILTVSSSIADVIVIGEDMLSDSSNVIKLAEDLHLGVNSNVVKVGTDLFLGVDSNISKVAEDLFLDATSNITVVASNLFKATTSEILSVGVDLQDASSKIATVGTNLQKGLESEITKVSDKIDEVTTVGVDLALGTTSKVITVADDLQDLNSKLTTVSGDLQLGVDSSISKVSGKIDEVTSVGTDLLSATSAIQGVYDDISDVTTSAVVKVANNLYKDEDSEILDVHSKLADIEAVSEDIESVVTVSDGINEITTISNDLNAEESVLTNISGNMDSVISVEGKLTTTNILKIDTVYADLHKDFDDDLDTVSSINNISENMPKVVDIFNRKYELTQVHNKLTEIATIATGENPRWHTSNLECIQVLGDDLACDCEDDPSVLQHIYHNLDGIDKLSDALTDTDGDFKTVADNIEVISSIGNILDDVSAVSIVSEDISKLSPIVADIQTLGDIDNLPYLASKADAMSLVRDNLDTLLSTELGFNFIEELYQFEDEGTKLENIELPSGHYTEGKTNLIVYMNGSKLSNNLVSVNADDGVFRIKYNDGSTFETQADNTVLDVEMFDPIALDSIVHIDEIKRTKATFLEAVSDLQVSNTQMQTDLTELVNTSVANMEIANTDLQTALTGQVSTLRADLNTSITDMETANTELKGGVEASLAITKEEIFTELADSKATTLEEVNIIKDDINTKFEDVQGIIGDIQQETLNLLYSQFYPKAIGNIGKESIRPVLNYKLPYNFGLVGLIDNSAEGTVVSNSIGTFKVGLYINEKLLEILRLEEEGDADALKEAYEEVYPKAAGFISDAITDKAFNHKTKYLYSAIGFISNNDEVIEVGDTESGELYVGSITEEEEEEE